MTLPTIEQARSWRGLTLVATDDEPVGRIEAIYVDRTTRQPEWALVHTGLFGSSRTFVPLADAAQRGDTVQVPHETSVVREAPRLEQDTELSEEDEARLYAHYGIRYTTEASSSGLPAGETASGDGGTAPAGATAPATDATTELPPSSRLQADAPAVAGVASGTAQTAAGPAAGNGRGKQAAAAGFGAVVLAAIAAGVAVLQRRRRQPPSLGERVGQVGREAADALTRAADELRRQAVAATSGGGEGARKAAKGGKRAARRTARTTERAGRGAADAALRAAQVAAAASLAAAATTGRAAREAARKGAKAGQDAAEGGRNAAQAAAEGSRRAAKQAGEEAAAAVAAAGATVDSKRRARKRARTRKRAAAATAATARTVAAAPAEAGRRVQENVGKKAQKVTPKRRRRSKMKLGKLGMLVGAAVGYVLGAKAGRERYEQMTASARQLLDKPQVKRVVDSVPGDLGARVEQVANKAADKVQQAGDKVAASGPGTSGTSGSTTGTTTTTTTPATPSTSSTSTSTTTPSVPATGVTTETGTTAAKRAASERKAKNS
jgi:PRC-barrel domain